MKTDFLVIGSGIAGLSFALKASKHGRIMVLTKKSAPESNTNYAQGGIAAAIGEDDSPRLHFQDTVRVGCGLCDEAAVEILVENAPMVIEELQSLGVEFDKDKQGRLLLSREAGHSRNRTVYIGDATGRGIEKALLHQVRRIGKDISLLEGCIAIDLIVEDGRCWGARALDVDGKRVFEIYSKVTVLATGGIGQIYRMTSNPAVATGDGIAMAHRAGASVKDMEFIQFHPTAFYKGGRALFLISETLRGEGGVLRNWRGEAFMKNYHKDGDLAPRDVAARSVYLELKKGPVYLDVRHMGDAFIKKRFPNIYRRCLRQGVDITKDLIPITPAAHYLCGGVKTNTYGETDIKGLFAFGECACTGVHGANRLAGNSLLESIVFSFRAEEKVTDYLEDIPRQTHAPAYPRRIAKRSMKAIPVRRELQSTMWDYVGIVRTREGLEHALEELDRLEAEAAELQRSTISPTLIELGNMIAVSRLTVQAALDRKESVGTHYVLR
ncbi:MAG: L-aspartate oxidase [Candidatus Bathyarchaeia archaeon]